MFGCGYFANRYFPDTYFPPVCIVTVKSGGIRFHPIRSEQEVDTVLDRIRREDEEILAIIIGAITSGVIK